MIRFLHRSARNNKGFSLTEVMIAAAIFAVLIAGFMPMFNVFKGGMVASEVSGTLKNEAQRSINQISSRLIECKRIFENSANDRAFLARVQMSGGPYAISGSSLPIKEEAGVLSPSSSSFVAASVGNSLFFASVDTPMDAIVMTASGSTEGVRVDALKFNYFFLGAESKPKLAGQAFRNLWRWESISYVDYTQLTSLSAIKSTNTIAALYAAGQLYAWDPSTTSVSSSFYLLTSTGGKILQPNHSILQNDFVSMVDPMTGISGGAFRVAVSPNTQPDWSVRQTVPLFGTASGEFPSGFEVVVVGSSGGRQVFIRLVLIAEGTFKGYMTHEQTVLTTARDIW